MRDPFKVALLRLALFRFLSSELSEAFPLLNSDRIVHAHLQSLNRPTHFSEPFWESQRRAYPDHRQRSLKLQLEHTTTKEQSSETVVETMKTIPNQDDRKINRNWLLTLCLPLWLVYVSNQWSRSSLYYLVDFSNGADPFKAMNVEVGFNEAQYGLLASIVFTSLFAVASLGAGAASDRYNRKVLTMASAVTWSVATVGTAFAGSYPQVVIWRIVMGLACAFSTPTAYTLIREQVPRDRVALASSLYGTGVALGSGLASLTLVLDTEIGWRQALLLVSSLGAVSVLISLLLLPDDPKGSTSSEEAKESAPSATRSVWDDVIEVVSTSRVKWLFLGSFFRFSAGLQIGVWGAPYFRVIFADSTSSYAVTQAVISAVGASISGLVGGATADWLTATASSSAASEQRNEVDAVGRRLWVPVVGSLLAVPTWYLAVNSEQSFETAMAWLAVEYLVAECWFGPTISTLQNTVGPRVGGTAQGLFTLTGAVANIAPTILGFVYSQAAGGGQSSGELSTLLSFGVCFGYLASSACFAVAAQSTPPERSKSY